MKDLRLDGIAPDRCWTAMSDWLADAPPELGALRERLAVCATREAPLGYLLADRIWRQTGLAADFLNLWECARFAGVAYSSLDDSMPLVEQLPLCPVRFVMLGNIMRHRYRFAAAEETYLEGIHRFPGDPILKFRLADLYLATYRLGPAQQILGHLQPVYPYAREMMFIGPTQDLKVPGPVFAELSADEASLVWFVAADSRYMDKYALNLARSVGSSAHMHFHTLGTPNTELYAELAASVPNPTLTARQMAIDDATPVWRKALYSVERFLLLAEVLAKYRKPMLVTDIDVECVRPPLELFERVTDIGYTHFRNTSEAWERYAATALLVQPTEASIAFFQRMAAMALAVLNRHPQPWFLDQILLFRLMEEFPVAQGQLLEHILTDRDSPNGYFRILHASWDG